MRNMIQSFFLVFWLQSQVQSRVYKYKTQDEVNYSTSLKVVDYQGNPLAGIVIKIKYYSLYFRYCNQHLIEHEIITDDSGIVELTGKLAKQDQCSFNVYASTQFNSITSTLNIQGVESSNGSILFKGVLQFDKSNKIDETFSIGTIYVIIHNIAKLKTLTKETPLPFSKIDFIVIYSKNEGNSIKFTSISDGKGEKIIHFLHPNIDIPLVIQYSASKQGFQNQKQLGNDLMLLPEKNYKLAIEIVLDFGQFELILTALVTDQDQNPIPEAELLVQCKDIQQKMDPASALSRHDGNIQISIPLRATSNIHLTFTITNNQYKKYRNEIHLTFDLDIIKDSFTHDLGIVRLQKVEENPQTTQSISITGKLLDEEKLTDNLIGIPLILNFKRCNPVIITQMYTQSDDQSKYQFFVETFIGEKYEVVVSVNGQPSFQVKNEKFDLTGPNTQEQFTQDIVLSRNIVSCTDSNFSFFVTGSIEDFQLKLIQNAQIQITTSYPLMRDTSFYNQSVVVTEGIFTLPFQCYNQVLTQINLQMQNDDYPNQILNPQEFICEEKKIQLMPIILSPKVVLITIKGKVSDQCEIINAVNGVNINFQLTPQDPLTSSVETVTDQDGNYILSFKAVKDQTYSIVIQAFHADFKEFESNFSIVADKDQTLVKDIQLIRIVIQLTLNINFIDVNGRSLVSSIISLEKIFPQIAQQYENKCFLDTSGKCEIKLSCYENTIIYFQMKLKAKTYKTFKTELLWLNCNGIIIDLTPVTINLQSKYINSMIEGQLINPKGIGQQAKQIAISTKPKTQNFVVQTGADGKWALEVKQLKFDVKYDIIESFFDALSQVHSRIQTFKSHEDNLTINFPTDYYDDFLSYNLNGQLLTKEMVVVSEIQVTLQCNQTVDKGGNYINLQQIVDKHGKFQFQWDMLVNFNSKIDCFIQSYLTEKFKQTQIQFQATPNTQEIQLNIIIELTDDFKGYLGENYQLVTIKGTVITECLNKENKVVKKGLQGVNREVKVWDGLQFVSIDYSSTSGKNGDYDLKMQILKKNLQVAIQLIFSKPFFIQSNIVLGLESAIQSGKWLIKSQNVVLLKNGGPYDCQTALQVGKRGRASEIKQNKKNKSDQNEETEMSAGTKVLIYLGIALGTIFFCICLVMCCKH